MASRLTDVRDIDFVLYEQLKVDTLLQTKRYEALNQKMFDMIIKEAATLAAKEIFPTYTACDDQGVTFSNGMVQVPECLKRPHRLLREGEWGALTEDPAYGGQGLPHVVAQAVMEHLTGANYILSTYLILGHGAGKMIDLFGTDEQKNLFLEKLYTGVWGGTMLLTEPNAGSDVGALTTSARPLDDGTWEISGSKIFITNGEQNLTENIIHPVLARIDGAPAGTKGISLFIVPKIWVNPDGTLGEPNDVVCTGVEKKMGIHGSPTCSISLGSRNKCRGFLLGEPNQGMQIMFHMMNEVRLEVGTQAFTSANLAYNLALDYAKLRLQGRSIEKMADRSAQQVAIIEHPDVRRMLLKMKSYVEGMRSLVYFIAFCFDRIQTAADDEQKKHYTRLTEILTPVVKAYTSEKGFDVCVEAMQVFGGYGYTKEFPIEQIVRDCKIASIYEGSNGIQAMDFIGRKIAAGKGKMTAALLAEFKTTIEMAQQSDALKDLGRLFEEAVDQIEEVFEKVPAAVFSESAFSALACAHPLLEACGDVVIAWMLLWRACIAQEKCDTPKGDFYKGKLKTAHFFIRTMLPITRGKLSALCLADHPAADMKTQLF